MKNKYTKVILQVFLVIFLIQNVTMAQTVQNPLRVIPKTPEAAAFDQFTNIGVNTAVGLPDISIPIYTLVDKNIKIPISVSYNASGVKIDDIATPVGLNWVLNAGGLISRNIIGIDDEDGNFGYFATSEADENSCIDGVLEDFYKGFKDPAPDVFTYSFMGKSGSFYYDKNRVLHKTINDAIKIETPLDGHEMRAWDEIGNCYYFAETESTQISVARNSGEAVGDLSGSGTTVWHLTKIVTPTNETINFEYESYSYSTGTVATSWDYKRSVFMGAEHSVPNALQANQSSIVYGTVQLKKISTPNQEITFKYEIDNSLSIMQKKLKSIYVKDLILNDTILRATLNHFSDARLWLSDVEFLGKDNQVKKKYSFQYNGKELPPYGSYQRDIFGYLNENQQPHMIPVTQGNQTYFSLTPAYREISLAGVGVGVLSEITYPTGGKAMFTYEPNYENKKSDDPYGVGEFFAPGLRVKTIEHFDENAQLAKREVYEYSKLRGAKLHKLGVFSFHFENRQMDTYQYRFFHWSSTPLQSMQTDLQFYNGFYYEKVSVKSYDHSDVASTITEKYIGLLDNFNVKPYISSQEYYKGNGELIKRNTFDYSNTFTNHTAHTLFDSYVFLTGSFYYDCLGNQFYNNVATPNEWMTHYCTLSPLLYQSSTILKIKETTSNYFNNKADSLYSEIHYEYNDHFLPSKITSYYSPNLSTSETKIESIKYPTDYTSSDSWLAQMKQNWIIGQPVDMRTFKRFGTQDKLIEGKTLQYADNGQLTKTFIWEGITPSSIIWNSSSVLSSEFQLKNEYVYDAGQIIQSTTNGNQLTSLMWGYNATLPVIKADNVSFVILLSAVTSAVGSVGYSNLGSLLLNTSDITNNTSQQTLWRNFNTTLRGNPLLKNSLITTYTYAPLIGLTSQTDAKGQVMYYKYDSFGQLKQILDDKQNILKEYTYNYTNYVESFGYSNTGQSQVFTKNNCSIGAGTTVTYYVPAHTYFSKISQADADQKALNEIALNGQNYANLNGECLFYNTAISQTFTKNDCPSGDPGSQVVYEVPAGKYTSTISQSDADQKAQNDMSTKGQAYANSHGTCASYPPYASLVSENEVTTYSGTFADIRINFYETSAKQTAKSVNNLSVNVKETVVNWYQEGTTEYLYNLICSGTSYIMGYQYIIIDSINEQSHSFELLPSTNYVIN